MLQKFKNIGPVIFCFITISAFAQMPGSKVFMLGADFQEPPHINTIYQLKNGYILLGTTKGLYKFDGVTFSSFEQASNVPDTVTAVCELANKEILLGYSNGLIGHVENNFIEVDSLEEGFPKVAITKIIGDKNNIVWFGTAGEGVYYLKNKRLYNIDTGDGLTDNFVYDVCEINANHIVAATDKGINICAAQEKNKVRDHFTSLNGLPDNIVRSLFITEGEDVWLGMQDGGIARYNVENRDAPKKISWPYGQVNAIAVINSNVFVATEDNGLLVFNRSNGDDFLNLQYKDDQLKKISCMLRDHEGNIWLAGNNLLMRSSSSNVQPLITLDKSTVENLHTLLWAKDSSIWFNTTVGVTQLKQRNGIWQQRNFIIPNVNGASISTLYEDINGHIWIGTLGKGIIMLNAATGKQQVLKEIPELINTNIISISGRDSSIWISAFEATVCVNLHRDNMSFTNYAGVYNLGNKYVYNILADKNNNVWFATDGKGIIKYQNGNFSNLQQPSGGYGNVVYKMAEDKEGNIWFSTYDKGLVKYDGKTFTRFTTSRGLSDMNITGLAISGDNVFLIHKNDIDLVNTKSGNISYLDADQGINNINTDLNALTTDPEGNVYFVADSILYKYNSAKEVVLRPIVMIDRIQLFLNDVDVKNGHVFKYNENNLSFYYTGLYYSQPNRIQYQYKLEGYDKNWVSTKDRIKNFPQLPPRTYTFKVRVSLNQNFSASYEAAFTFTIEQPFWRQAWFIILSIVVLAAILYLIIHQREKTIKKYNKLESEKIRSQLETLRNQINPHFLFNSFNTLISEIEENPDKAVLYVEHLSDFYRSIVVHREKDIISLQEEINILNDYCFIQQKRYGEALQINISIPLEQQKKYYIVPLALQLLFENAVKHNVISSEHPLCIELFIEDEEHLVVRNNINPKFTPEKGSSMGLQNIQKRYLLLSKKNVVVENDGKYFKVSIPLIKQ